MPNPRKNQSKKDFLDMFMADESMVKKYPDEEQRYAVALSEWKKSNSSKEIKYRNVGLKLVEIDGEFYSEGWVATTHPDRAVDSREEVDGDILTKEVLEQITKMINDGPATTEDIGSTRTVSYRHDWIKEGNPNLEPAGMVVPPAEVKEYVDSNGEADGHWGVWVKVHHNKNHPKFKELLYEVEHGYIPGYSIEYVPGESSRVNFQGKVYRLLKSIVNYVGHAFADARMIANPHAIITGFGYKEIIASKEKDKPLNKPFRLPKGSSKKFGVYVKKGDKIIKVTFGDPDMEIRRDNEDARNSFRARHKCDTANDKTTPRYWSCRMWEKEASFETINFSAKEISDYDKLFNIKEETKMDIEAIKKKKASGEKLTPEEEKALKKYESEKKPMEKEVEQPEEKKEPVSEKPEEKEVIPEKKEAENKEVNIKEITAQILESAELKEALAAQKVENKTLKNTEEKTMNVSIKEMNDALKGGDLVSAKEAAMRFEQENDLLAKTLDEKGSASVGASKNLNIKAVGKGLKIFGSAQTKDTLVVGDNTSSYTQADVELPDLFAPGIIDTFNNQTNLFGFLKKEQHLGGSHYQWKMVTNRDPNSTDTFVAQTDVSVIKNFSSKGNYQTPIKIARRGVSVSDFMNDYSAASLGNLFQLELDLQMKEMMNDVNAALFAEVADGTGTAPLGLEAVADSAGNTTLYGYTRSTSNRLSPDSAGDTYTAVGGSLTEAVMRTKIANLIDEGVAKRNLAIVASPTSLNYLFNLLDGNRRFATTEAAFGFDRMTVPMYDGIPIIEDKDCNSDAIYFIDVESDVIVVAKEPRVVQLAKVGAGVEAYVQMDFAHVYKQPRRIGMLDTLSGP